MAPDGGARRRPADQEILLDAPAEAINSVVSARRSG
jgi:hypothetical protein